MIDSSALLVEINKLAILAEADYELIRESEAKRLNVRISFLDKQVEAARLPENKNNDTKHLLFPVVEPWQGEIILADMLEEITSLIKKFIVCDDETAVAAALWCAFTWIIEFVKIAPLLVINAPEKRCGKTQLLNVLSRLSNRSLDTSNISTAALFRVIEAHKPTLFIDEVDTFLKGNEEMRGVINSGHTRQSAFVIRNVGDNHEPTCFCTWGAKALAGIGKVSDTISDRAIVLSLRRKLPGETVERLRHADNGQFKLLVKKLARFAQDYNIIISNARPTLPASLNDREQDNWEPLFAIADCAGGHWPQTARSTALKICGSVKDAGSTSTELLTDIAEILMITQQDKISSASLWHALNANENKQWAIYDKGKDAKPSHFARLLKPFGIKSKNIRVGESIVKGFERSDFTDALYRYLDISLSNM